MITLKTLFTTTEETGAGSMEINDLRSLLRTENVSADIMVIDTLISSDPGKGEGSSFLQELCSRFSDHIIILKAGALPDVYDTEPDPEQLSSVLKKLTRFYERNGFLNVNHIIGGFENSIVFVHNNSAWSQLGMS